MCDDGEPLGTWALLSREELADFKVFRVRRDTLRSPRTGEPHPFYVLDCPDWVNVVALTPEGNAVLVRQWRSGTETETLEIPGGSMDAADASPQAAAERELLEETGCVAERWTLLGAVDPNPAIQGNACWTFLAEGVRKVAELSPDAGEDLRVTQAPIAELPELVRSGKIRHSLVVAAFYWLSLFRGR